VSMLPAPARPDVLATEVINTLTRREDEIRSLRVELEQLRRQAADRKRASLSSVSLREEKDFKARVAPPPPPLPSALRASAAVPRQSDHVSVSDLASRASDLANAAPTSDAVNALASPTSASSSAFATATSTEGEPTGSADVRSALFAAIRSKPKASAEPLSDPDPLPDVPDRSALMAALRSRSAPAAKGPASSPAGSSTPSASSPDPVSVSTGAAAQDPTAAPDLRAALMTALRSRPAASFDITPTAEGPDPTPAPATELRPTAAAPTASLVSESNGAAGPTVDLRAALMAGIRKGPPAKSASPQVAPRAPPAAAPSKKLKVCPRIECSRERLARAEPRLCCSLSSGRS
jgi:diaphanous 1